MRLLKYSLAAEARPNSRYKKTIIDDIPLNKLLTTYKLPIYCIVHDSILDELRAFDLTQFKEDIINRPITITEYLTSIDNIPVDYLDAIPELHAAYARYADVFYAGYSVTPWSSMSDSVDITVKQPWLKLTKNNLDYKKLFNTSLISVNGLIHQTDYNSAGLYVVDGNKTATLQKKNNIGIINISEFGAFEFKYFNREIQLCKADEAIDLYSEAYLVFNEDISQKTPIFVVGGHIFINHPAFQRFDQNTYRIHFDLLDFRGLVFDLHTLLKSSNPNLNFDSSKFNLISNDVLYSDEMINSIMDMSQSFVIFIDKHFFIEDIPLTVDQVSNWICTKELPDKPLVGYQGKIMDYVWQDGGDDEYILHCDNSHYDNRVLKWPDITPHTDQLDANRAKRKQKPYFFFLGLDL